MVRSNYDNVPFYRHLKCGVTPRINRMLLPSSGGWGGGGRLPFVSDALALINFRAWQHQVLHVES